MADSPSHRHSHHHHHHHSHHRHHRHHRHHHASGSRAATHVKRSSSSIKKTTHGSGKILSLSSMSQRSKHCHTCHRGGGSHSRSCRHHHKHSHSSLSRSDFSTTRSTKATRGIIETILLTLFGIAAFIFIIIGIWLLAASLGWPVALNLTGNADWTRTISFGCLTLITGLVMILLLIFAILAFTSGRSAPRIATVFLAAIVFMLLLTMTIVAIMFATLSTNFMDGTIAIGWKNSVANRANSLCKYQENNQCAGFNDGDCSNCVVDNNYATCSDFCPRCGQKAAVRQLLLPAPIARVMMRSREERSKRLRAAQGVKVRQVAASDIPPYHPPPPPAPAGTPAAVPAAAPAPPYKHSPPPPTFAVPTSPPSYGAATAPSPKNGTYGYGAGAAVNGSASPSPNGTSGATAVGGGAGVGVAANAKNHGCRRAIREDFRRFFVPFAVFTSFLALLALIQFFFICCVLFRNK